jgi:phosphopantetheine adenylyltransferase
MQLNIKDESKISEIIQENIIKLEEYLLNGLERKVVFVDSPDLLRWSNQSVETCLTLLYDIGHGISVQLGNPLFQMDVLFQIDRKEPCKDGKYDNVILGGTFDHLHSGHKILLSLACWSSKKRLVVGVIGEESLALTLDYSPERLAKKKFNEWMQPLEKRIEAVKEFIHDFKPDLLQVQVVPIQDDFGPTRTDPDMDLIVGSVETQSGCNAGTFLN